MINLFYLASCDSYVNNYRLAICCKTISTYYKSSFKYSEPLKMVW